MRIVHILIAASVAVGSASAQATKDMPPVPPVPPVPPTRPVQPAPPIASVFGKGWAFDSTQSLTSAFREFSYRMNNLASGYGEVAQRLANSSTEMALQFSDVAVSMGGLTHSLGSVFDMGSFDSQDPADSLYRTAHEAMNRGDWRRAADVFGSIKTRFPQSNRLAHAAYYEAFANYRIGSLESLRDAYRILTERAKSSNSAMQGEVASLTTRVRGALASRGDAQASADLQRTAQNSSRCDREDTQLRIEALSALASADPASAWPTLERVLQRRDECSALRRHALSIMLRRNDSAATSVAISIARNKQEEISFRSSAISYLYRSSSDQAVKALQDILRDDGDERIQSSALMGLAHSSNAQARTSIRSIVENSSASERLRSDAIMAISARSSSPDDAAYLRSVYPRLTGERLRNSAISAIARLGGDDNEQFLLGIARSVSEPSETRSFAIGRLARSKTIPISDWHKVYESAESRNVRSSVISVYRERQEQEATDRLIEIIEKSTDPSLRSVAINALRRKDDARARKVLQDIVDRR